MTVMQLRRPESRRLVSSADDLAEYEQLAQEVNFDSPALNVEKLRRILVQHDIPVFALREVVTYMDRKAAQESKDRAGWLWRPLRQKDREVKIGRFGTSSGFEFGLFHDRVRPASDFYGGYYDKGIETKPYGHAVPVHALRKVAVIERHFDGAAFFVSDYAPAPQFAADPFLMVAVANDQLQDRIGRFVIDFWDEPGFGIEKQIV